MVHSKWKISVCLVPKTANFVTAQMLMIAHSVKMII